MTRVLLILIGLGAVAFLVLKQMPSPNPQPGADPVAVAEGDAGDTGSGRALAKGGSRFQDLMQKATGGGALASEEGLRAYVRRVDPSLLTFAELEELFVAIEDDPGAALELVDRVLLDTDRKWGALQKETLLRRSGLLAATVDPASLEGRLEDLKSDAERSEFVVGAAEGMSKDDVEDGLLWIDSLADRELQTVALKGVGTAWVQQDLDSALAWAEGLGNADEKRAALRGVVGAWVDQDADEAFDFALNAPDDSKDGLIVEAASSVLSDDPKKAAEWVVNASSDPQLKAVLEAGVLGWAEDDFNEVSDWAMMVGNSDLRDSAVISLTDYWAQDDPQKATEWAENYPTHAERAQMLEKTLTRWATKDPSEAAGWFGQQEVDLATVKLLNATLRTMAGDDVLAAQALLDQISDPALKSAGGSILQSFSR